MKKFTLLVALMICAVSFGQRTERSSAQSIAAPVSKAAKATEGQTKAGNLVSVVSLGLERGTVSAHSGTKFAVSKIAKVTGSSNNYANHPDGPALLQRLSEIGNSFGSMAQYFTPEEFQILKGYMAAGHGVTSNVMMNIPSSFANANEMKQGAVPQQGMTSVVTTTYNGVSTTNYGESVLADLAYTSGPYFNVAGPPDISFLQDASLGMGTFGFGAQIPAGNRVAEDFILSDDYEITSFVFYAYQTGSTPPSINEINVQVWDGDPSAGGSVIWGDTSTNVLSNVVWSGAYRQLESSPGDTSRAIQEVTVDVTGLSLPAGTYWVDYAFGGTGASGPWAPPVVITGQAATGNAKQSIGGVWGDLVDVGAQGLPINVYGNCTSCGGGGTPTDFYVENAFPGTSPYPFGTMPIAGPYSFTAVGPGLASAYFADDIDDTGTLYALNFDLTTLDIVDLDNGTATTVGALTGLAGGHTITGLSFDANSGTMYALSTDGGTSTIYTVNTATGALTTVGNTGTSLGIWLEIDDAGNAYMADLDDNLYSINLGTGAATVIGALGIDINFAQDASYDSASGTLYANFYTAFGDSGVYTVDTATGAATFVYDTQGIEHTMFSVGLPTGGGGGGVACNQDNPSNNFEIAYFSSDGPTAPLQIIAADATVAAGEDFTLQTIQANLWSTPGSIVASAEIVVYGDASGAPDPSNVIVTHPAVVPTSQAFITSAFGFDVLDVVMDIPPTVLAGDAGSDSTYWISIYLTMDVAGADGLWEASSASIQGNTGFFSADGGVTWFSVGNGDMVYDFIGECAPIGGGGGGNACNQEHPLSANPGGGVGSSVDSDFKSASDVIVAAGEQFTVETIDAVFLTFAPTDPPTTATIKYYTDNGGLPGNEIGSETVVPTIVSSAPWVNPVADQYITTMSVTPFTFFGDPLVETTYWIEISMGTATNQPTVFWEYNRDGVVGNALAQFNGGTGTWSHPDLDGDGNPDLDAEVIYNYAGTCDPLEVFTNDDCEGALEIACGDVVQGETLTATNDNVPDCDPNVPNAPGVWYKWEDTSGLAANVSFSTCSANTDYDTQLTVYEGPCTNLVCVANNDDDPNCTNFQSTVEFTTDGSATTYYILVQGFNGATGNFELTMTCDLIPPPNDDIANAIDLDEVGCPFTDEDVAMPAATTEGGNPTNCDISGANGVWYVFTPTINGQITGSIASPAGFSSVTFYTAPDESSSEDELVLVDWWQNQCVPGTEATIPVVANQTYYCFVVNSGGITDIVFDNCQLGVASNEIEGFAYYPNPTNDNLNLSAMQNIESVAIYNILGQRVIDMKVNATQTQVNVSHLTAGAYIMEVMVDGQKGAYKVIKN